MYNRFENTCLTLYCFEIFRGKINYTKETNLCQAKNFY